MSSKLVPLSLLISLCLFGSCSQTSNVQMATPYPSEISAETAACIEQESQKLESCLVSLELAVNRSNATNAAQSLYELASFLPSSESQDELRQLAGVMSKSLWKPNEAPVQPARTVLKWPDTRDGYLYFENAPFAEPQPPSQPPVPQPVHLTRSTITFGRQLGFDIPRIIQHVLQIEGVIVEENSNIFVYNEFPSLEKSAGTYLSPHDSLLRSQKLLAIEKSFSEKSFDATDRALSAFIDELPGNEMYADMRSSLQKLSASIQYALLRPLHYPLSLDADTRQLQGSLPSQLTSGVQAMDHVYRMRLNRPEMVNKGELFGECRIMNERCFASATNAVTRDEQAHAIALCSEPLQYCDRILDSQMLSALYSEGTSKLEVTEKEKLESVKIVLSQEENPYLRFLKYHLGAGHSEESAPVSEKATAWSILFPLTEVQKNDFCLAYQSLSGLTCSPDELTIQATHSTFSSLLSHTGDEALKKLLRYTDEILQNKDSSIDRFLEEEMEALMHEESGLSFEDRLFVFQTLSPFIAGYFLRAGNYYAMRPYVTLNQAMADESQRQLSIACTACSSMNDEVLQQSTGCLTLHIPFSALTSRSPSALTAEYSIRPGTPAREYSCYADRIDEEPLTATDQKLFHVLGFALAAAVEDDRDMATQLSLEFVDMLQLYYKSFGMPSALNHQWNHARLQALSCGTQGLINALVYQHHPLQALLIDRKFKEIFPASHFIARNAYFNKCVNEKQYPFPALYPMEEIQTYTRWIQDNFTEKNKKLPQKQKAFVRARASKFKNTARIFTSFAAFANGQPQNAVSFVSDLTAKKSVSNYPRHHAWEKLLEAASGKVPSASALSSVILAIPHQDPTEGYLLAHFLYPYLGKEEKDAVITALRAQSPQNAPRAAARFFRTYQDEIMPSLTSEQRVQTLVWLSHSLRNQIGNQSLLLVHFQALGELAHADKYHELLAQVRRILDDSMELSLNSQQSISLSAIEYATECLLHSDWSQEWKAYRYDVLLSRLENHPLESDFRKLDPRQPLSEQDYRGFIQHSLKP